MKATEFARFVDGKIEGDENFPISIPTPIELADKNSTVFLLDKKYDTDKSIGVVIASRKPEHLKYSTLILVDNVKEAFIKTLSLFEKKPQPPLQQLPQIVGENTKISSDAIIYPFTYISNNVTVGKNSRIFPFVFIGENVEIGENTVIYPHVYIGHNVKIGNNVIVHAGTVIGADGFGFERTESAYEKIPQIGGVIIEDNVEIGANCTIDRATIGYTVIKNGVKLDDQVHVAHNVKIGEHTVIAAQSGIAGSTEIGKWVMMGGQVGIKDHLRVADYTIVMAQSGITKDTKQGKMYVGSPARETRRAWKELALLSKIDELFKKVRELERRLEEKND